MMRPFPHSSSVALLALITIGCADQKSEAKPGDVIPVEPSLFIGTAYGDSTQEFHSIAAIAASPDGRILVADGRSQIVRIYDTDGAYRSAFGGSGQAPGEFERIRSLAVKGDTVAVLDVGNQNISLVRLRDGALVSRFPVANIRGGALEGNASRMFFWNDTTVAIGVGGAWPQGHDEFDEVRVYHTNGQLLASQRVQRREALRHSFPTAMGFDATIQVPFAPWSVWALTPAGAIVEGWGGEYLTVLRHLSGDTISTSGREVAPLPIDAESRSRAEHWVRRMMEGFAALDRAPKPDLPATQQQMANLSVSSDGQQLWVERTSWAYDPVYDIFQNGEYRCTVRLSGGGYRTAGPSVAAVVDGDRILRVGLDSLDASYVIGYRTQDAPDLHTCLSRGLT